MFLGRFVTLELLHPKALKSDSERILTRFSGLVRDLQRQQPTSVECPHFLKCLLFRVAERI
jgi:hypothetical protein